MAIRTLGKPTPLDPAELHKSIIASLPELKKLLKACASPWGYEDSVYRFYHQSFKVFRLQDETLRIHDALRALAPGLDLNPWFLEIVRKGTGRSFSSETNKRWLAETRPILEAFFHAKYFLEMVVRYGKVPDPGTSFMPSGWAALLYLYNSR